MYRHMNNTLGFIAGLLLITAIAAVMNGWI
jgi:hypothetical protein